LGFFRSVELGLLRMASVGLKLAKIRMDGGIEPSAFTGAVK
jgi:hypothetical protein